MYDLPTTFYRNATSVTPSDFGLPPDLLAKARSRIAGLAGVLGTLSFIAMLVNATAFREEVDSAVQPQHLLAVGLALVVVVTARSKRIADITALSIGLVYEVCLCWIVSFAAQHDMPTVTVSNAFHLSFPRIRIAQHDATAFLYSKSKATTLQYAEVSSISLNR